MKPKRQTNIKASKLTALADSSKNLEPKSQPVAKQLGPSGKSSTSTNSIGSRSTQPKHEALIVYTCAGCKRPIKRDKFLLRACDDYWHENCLRCDRCHSRLGELGSTLYRKSDMNLCRQDYLELFGRTGVCSVCDRHISASEMVMRAKDNYYHLECFACQVCNQRFCVGDRFYLCENKVVCQYDFEDHILPIQHAYLESQCSQALDTYCVMNSRTTEQYNNLTELQSPTVDCLAHASSHVCTTQESRSSEVNTLIENENDDHHLTILSDLVSVHPQLGAEKDIDITRCKNLVQYSSAKESNVGEQVGDFGNTVINQATKPRMTTDLSEL